jgi:bacillithiol biosynthesis cysteine-adding enzyme BshC
VARALSASYLARDAAACAFFPYDFRDAAARISCTRRAVRRRTSPALIAALREQHARLPSSAARRENLDCLAAGEAAVVVTGQQVGLFLGPLYTFYKAASAIAVARAIQAESGIRCVPLFWLQTEDHDFAEIARCAVAGDRGVPLDLTLPPEAATHERTSIAHRVLAPEIGDVVGALADALGPGAAAAEVMALVRAHYVAGRPLAQAFAGVLAELFADEGLLFLDPRTPAIAALAAPIHRRAIADADTIDAQLIARATALETAGFTEQVPLRPGSLLTFVHDGAATGPRYRPRRPRDNSSTREWLVSNVGGTMSPDALLATLDRDPMRFSTSALLRPILQDTLLPTVAYVGGLAEVSYFGQLMPLYAHYGLDAPLVVPRARFRVIDARARRWLAALNLTPNELSLPAHALALRLTSDATAGHADPAALKQRIAQQIVPQVSAIAGAVVAAAPHLDDAAKRTQASVTHVLGRLLDRYARVLVDRDDTVRGKLDRLQNALCPGGVPQERAFAWVSMAATVGHATLKQLVMDRLTMQDAFVTNLQDIMP